MSEKLRGASAILTIRDKCLREQLITDQVLEQAFAWLCHQRRHWPPDADVWCVRSQWQSVKDRLVRDLSNGTYRFEPMPRITKANGDIIHVWSARDALVLKALAIVPRQRAAIVQSLHAYQGACWCQSSGSSGRQRTTGQYVRDAHRREKLLLKY